MGLCFVHALDGHLSRSMDHLPLTQINPHVDDPQGILTSKKEEITRKEVLLMGTAIDHLPVFELLGSIPFQDDPIEKPHGFCEATAVERLGGGPPHW